MTKSSDAEELGGAERAHDGAPVRSGRRSPQEAREARLPAGEVRRGAGAGARLLGSKYYYIKRKKKMLGTLDEFGVHLCNDCCCSAMIRFHYRTLTRDLV